MTWLDLTTKASRQGLDGGGDSTVEVPFVNGTGSVKFVDKRGTTNTLADQAKSKNSMLAVGQWNGSATSVFYANSSNDGIWRANPDSEPVQVNALSGSSNTSSAILGISDIDSDSGSELIFAGSISSGSSNQVNYVTEDGSLENIPNSGINENNNKGIGAPADFDGDGKASVPIVDGSGNLKLLNSTGVESTITIGGEAVKTPLATRDVDGDGDPEIVYIESGTDNLKYIDTVAENPTRKFVKAADGSNVSASDKRGVA